MWVSETLPQSVSPLIGTVPHVNLKSLPCAASVRSIQNDKISIARAMVDPTVAVVSSELHACSSQERAIGYTRTFVLDPRASSVGLCARFQFTA